ncbi:TPA: DUF5085 family protein [Staphylococcus aureus]
MNELSYSTIMFRNVISKEYLDIDLKNLNEVTTHFLNEVKHYDLNENGPLILTINQLMKNEKVNITIYSSINNISSLHDSFEFQSYLYIDQMLHNQLRPLNYEEDMKKGLEDIERFAKENQLQRISPYYFILNDVNGFKWIDIKVKVMEY